MGKSIYLTGHWKRLRKIALVRCGGRCEGCGRELAGAGHLHHLTYERAGQELETDVEILCLLCHGNEHPSRTFLAPILHRRRQEEVPIWKSRKTKNAARRARKKERGREKNQKRQERKAASNAAWEEINGAAYANLMEKQRSATAAKVAREERERQRKENLRRGVTKPTGHLYQNTQRRPSK